MRKLWQLALLSTLLFFVIGCNSYFFQPTRQLYYPPEKFHLLYHQLKFPSKDGTELAAWFFPAQKNGKVLASHGTVVQFHGNAENMSSHYTGLVWLTQHGFNLFVWDYRGYGISKGEASREGVYEDSLVALQEAHKQHEAIDSSKPFVLVGQSLGGAIAMRAYEDSDLNNEIDLIVLDSTFASYRRVAFKALSKHWFTFLVSPLAYVLVSENKGPNQFWSEVKAPVLVVHDKSDPVVPYSCGENVFEKIQGRKQMWSEDLGGHIRLLSNPDSETAKKFLSRLFELNH
ncbi:MAG: alpha/beta fold hydrolase [Bdellovibrionales bacterium]|nr:alpha/beta fold hydrolase [Bdellovibrionales bacterium]